VLNPVLGWIRVPRWQRLHAMAPLGDTSSSAISRASPPLAGRTPAATAL